MKDNEIEDEINMLSDKIKNEPETAKKIEEKPLRDTIVDYKYDSFPEIKNKNKENVNDNNNKLNEKDESIDILDEYLEELRK